MKNRKTGSEHSEEHAKRELLKHLHTCSMCSPDNPAKQVCPEARKLTLRWGHLSRLVDQERRAIAGCS